MTTSVSIRPEVFNTEDILPLLTRYQMLPQLHREQMIDRAIAPFACTESDIEMACEQFFQQRQLMSAQERQTWLAQRGMTVEDVEAIASRLLRIEMFKQATWGHKVESYFLKRKSDLDEVVYSLIRTTDANLIQELFFRIQDGEQSFSDLARRYSQGLEAYTGGIHGPIELGLIEPNLAQLLRTSRPGQLHFPIRIETCFVMVRLEALIPQRLDQAMRQRLLQELFEQWLQDQLR
ncbi:MAG TPA: peptidylprolyl isomerase [Crinalium sp.]|jgi:parvulin-like peptidyl-prolyl isomerase